MNIIEGEKEQKDNFLYQKIPILPQFINNTNLSINNSKNQVEPPKSVRGIKKIEFNMVNTAFKPTCIKSFMLMLIY